MKVTVFILRTFANLFLGLAQIFAVIFAVSAVSNRRKSYWGQI